MGGPEPTPAPGRSLGQAAYLTAGMGIVHAVLLLVSFWILRTMPGPGAAEATLQAFYGGADRRRVLAVGLYLLPFAAIAFVWFIVALRMWVGSHGRPEQALFSNVQLVSGIVFIALLLEAAAAYSIDAAVVEFSNGSLNPALARQFPQLGRVLGLVLAMRLAAMFVIATSSIGRHTRVLPAWFIWLGYLVGAFLFVVFPIWVLTLCVLLLVRARHLPLDATPPRAAI
jgi:Na+-transporting methylmalonyl-CoA/oxaloacetate decarboxylase gamma subunit